MPQPSAGTTKQRVLHPPRAFRESGRGSDRAMGPAPEWPGRPNFWARLSGRSRGERLYGPKFLGILLLDLMNRKRVLQIKPELLGGAKIFG